MHNHFKGDQLQMVRERLRLAEGLRPQKTGGPRRGDWVRSKHPHATGGRKSV